MIGTGESREIGNEDLSMAAFGHKEAVGFAGDIRCFQFVRERQFYATWKQDLRVAAARQNAEGLAEDWCDELVPARVLPVARQCGTSGNGADRAGSHSHAG